MASFLFDDISLSLHVVVGAASGNFTGPVNLLSNDEAYQLMGKDQVREAPHGISASPHRIVHPVGPTNHQHYLLKAQLSLQQASQGRRAQHLTALIEQHQVVITIDLFKNAAGLLSPGSFFCQGRVGQVLPRNIPGLAEAGFVTVDAILDPLFVFLPIAIILMVISSPRSGVRGL